MSETATVAQIKTIPTSYKVNQIFVVNIKEGNYINVYNITANNLEDAIKESKDYCSRNPTKRRFIHVRPFISDLKARDEQTLENPI